MVYFFRHINGILLTFFFKNTSWNGLDHVHWLGNNHLPMGFNIFPLASIRCFPKKLAVPNKRPSTSQLQTERTEKTQIIQRFQQSSTQRSFVVSASMVWNQAGVESILRSGLIFAWLMNRRCEVLRSFFPCVRP